MIVYELKLGQVRQPNGTIGVSIHADAHEVGAPDEDGRRTLTFRPELSLSNRQLLTSVALATFRAGAEALIYETYVEMGEQLGRILIDRSVPR